MRSPTAAHVSPGLAGTGAAAEDGEEDGEDEEGASSTAASSPRKGGGALATHSASGRGVGRGALFARRLSSLRREGGDASATRVMEAATLAEALGPRVRAPALHSWKP